MSKHFGSEEKINTRVFGEPLRDAIPRGWINLSMVTLFKTVVQTAIVWQIDSHTIRWNDRGWQVKLNKPTCYIYRMPGVISQCVDCHVRLKHGELPENEYKEGVTGRCVADAKQWWS